MTREDIDNIISIICPNDEDFEKPIISPAYLKKELEVLALEQEPKKGHWIDVDGIFFKCSECDAYRKMMPAYKEYYCPNCGAKMTESEE